MLEKHGASVEHNMQAVREYAVNVVGRESGRTVQTAPKYVVMLNCLIVILLLQPLTLTNLSLTLTYP